MVFTDTDKGLSCLNKSLNKLQNKQVNGVLKQS